MPLFLHRELSFTNFMIARMLTFYEISTLFGTIALGMISDLLYAKRSPVAILFVVFASLVAFFITNQYKDLTEL